MDNVNNNMDDDIMNDDNGNNDNDDGNNDNGNNDNGNYDNGNDDNGNNNNLQQLLLLVPPFFQLLPGAVQEFQQQAQASLHVVQLLTQIQEQLQQVQQDVQQVQQDVQQVQQDVQQVQQDVQQVQQSIRAQGTQMSLRLANSRARYEDSISMLPNDVNVFPAVGVGNITAIPATKRALHDLTAAPTDALIAFYGLIVPPGTNVSGRRTLLSEYLGIL